MNIPMNIPSATDAAILVRLTRKAVTKHYGTTDDALRDKIRSKINPRANNRLLTQWGRTYAETLAKLRADPSIVQKVVDAEEYADLEWPTPAEFEQDMTSAIYEGIARAVAEIATRVLREMPELRELQEDLASINTMLNPVFDRLSAYDRLDEALTNATEAQEWAINPENYTQATDALADFDNNNARRFRELDEAFSPEAMEAAAAQRAAEQAQRDAEQAETERLQAQEARRAARATAIRQQRAEEEFRNLEERRQAEERDRQFNDAMSQASYATEANNRMLEQMQNEELNSRTTDQALRALEERLRAADEARIAAEAHSLEVLEGFKPSQSWNGGWDDLIQASQAHRTQPRGSRR